MKTDTPAPTGTISPPKNPHMASRLLVLGLGALSACSPTEPPDPPPPPPTVSTVEVTSPIGGIIVVNDIVQLAADATDQNGQPVTASFTWASQDDGIANVDATGVVTGVGPGVTRITASAGVVSGTIDVTVSAADLPGIQTLLDDPFADALFSSVGGATEAAVRATWTTCSSGRAAGNLTAVRDCLAQARTDLGQSTDQSKTPLLSLVGLFVDWIERLLNLP